MSYDITLSVKAEGTNQYVRFAEPEFNNPTYNLGDMFRACMDWDYEQGIYYPCDKVIRYIERGIKELKENRGKYEIYNPENGWGDLDQALDCLKTWRAFIYEQAENIPIEAIYFQW